MLATSTAGFAFVRQIAASAGHSGLSSGTGAGFPGPQGPPAEHDQRFPAPFAADPPGGPRKTSRVKSRDEHLTWAKQRALISVDRGDFARAVKGLRADLDEHPLTKGLVSSDQARRGFKDGGRALGRGSQALAQWIEDFK